MADIFPESREEEILVSMIDGEEYDKAPESRIEALLLELKEVIEEGGGGGGTTNYNLLQNKPSINSVTLTGDKSLEDLSIPTASDLAGKQDALPVTASGNDVAFNGDIIDGQGNTLSVLAEALTKTASGNPVVISDCAGGKARSLKTVINAIQDLHGYDKPWAGGAGKNKLDSSAVTQGSFDDPSATANCVSDYTPISGGADYYMSGNSGYADGIYLRFYDANKTELDTSTRISKYVVAFGFTTPSTAVYTRIMWYKGGGLTPTNVVNALVQLEIGTAATSFAPYSNICPISGRTAVAVDDVGKNKVPMTVSNLKALNTSGTWTGNVYTLNNTTIEILTDAANNVTGIKTNTGSGGASGLIIFKLSDSTLSVKTGDIMTGCPTGGATNKYMLNVSGTPFSDTGNGGTCAADATGTLNLDIFAGATLSNALWYPMIRDASAPSGFVPYAHSSATIQLGQTVYGAEINWDTGVATVLWASKTFSDIDNWNFNASYHIAYCYVTGKANGYDTIMSDSYKVVNKPYAEMVDGEISAVQGQDGLNVKDDRFDNLSDFMTAMGSSQLVYKLATPIALQLTPTQLSLLKGYNCVTIDNGNIDLLAYIGKAWS